MKRTISLVVIAIAVTGFWWFMRKPMTVKPMRTTLPIAASFYPLAEFAKSIGKDNVAVVNITKAGIEPHDYEPTPQDLVAIHTASVFIFNGHGFQPWAEKVASEVSQKGILVVDVSQGKMLLSGIGDDNTIPDPHTWLDPILAVDDVEQIKKALIEKDPTHAIEYTNNANQYERQLKAVDQEYSSTLKVCRKHVVITSHAAMAYLGKRYNFTVVPIAGLSPDEEPSPKHLAEIADTAKKYDLSVIFTEPLISAKLSETIAREVGATTLVFNPLEGLTDAELAKGETYLSVMRKNLTALKTAMECL